MADTQASEMLPVEQVGDHDAWVLAQLKAWPTRVHPERTTNIEYLMKEAAKLIDAKADLQRQLDEARKEAFQRGRDAGFREGYRTALANIKPG